MFVRISATDCVENGWVIHDSIQLSKELKKLGVSIVDVSSGGITPDMNIFEIQKPGFHVEFAEKIKKDADIPTAVAGLITDPLQAESIFRKRQGRSYLIRERTPQESQLCSRWPDETWCGRHRYGTFL